MLPNAKVFCGVVAGGAEEDRTPDLCSAIARHARVFNVFRNLLRGTLGKPRANGRGTSSPVTADLPHTKRPATGRQSSAGLTNAKGYIRYGF